MTERVNKNLGQCHICQTTISKKAKACPHCGERKSYRASSKLYLIASIVTMVVMILIISGSDKTSQNSMATPRPINTSPVSNSVSDKNKQEDWIYESQDGVRERLKDPASAKFKDTFFVRWNNTPVVCGFVNSKNSMGGYSGFQRFIASGKIIAYLEEEISDFEKVWNEICVQ